MTTIKKYSLPRDFAEKWVAALRSGKYKQAIGSLHTPGVGYCCLGVGAKICGAKNDLLNWGYLRDSWLPKNVSEQLPDLLKGDRMNNFVNDVSTMNDDGSSFSEIADWIEINVEFV